MAFSFRRIASIHLKYLRQPEMALNQLRKASQCARRAALKFLQVTIEIDTAETLRRLNKYEAARAELGAALMKFSLKKRGHLPHVLGFQLRDLGLTDWASFKILTVCFFPTDPTLPATFIPETSCPILRVRIQTLAT
jgi:hypothetical protein